MKGSIVRIFLPAGATEVEEKKEWFSWPICQELRKKGLGFGFELKGSTSCLSELGVPCGIHLPGSFADDWQEKEEARYQEIAPCLDFKPLYVVTHGLRVNPEVGLTPQTERYFTEATAQGYSDSFERMIKLIEQLQSFGLPVAVENVAITNFSKEEGAWQSKTHLDLRMPSLPGQMLKLRAINNCQLVLDVQKLAFAFDFLCRRGPYKLLEMEGIKNASVEEQRTLTEHGIYIRPGTVPFAQADYVLLDEIKRLLESISVFHLSGCLCDGTFLEVRNPQSGPVIASHDEIKNNAGMIKILEVILQKEDAILVVEVAGSEFACHQDRDRDVQQRSFKTLCFMINDLI